MLGLLGPLLTEPVDFVKGHFRRPFKLGDTTQPDGGGRVTELLARPYLNLHFPELAGFRQPLAGEIAATRSLLRAPPLPGRLRHRDRDADRRATARSASSGWRRSTSARARTATSRSPTCRGWRSRCSPRPSAARTARAIPARC